ncbi:Quinic acid utilization activator [Fusarium oxysporum f. sp. cubense race 1]|uniref:Quinic acid utilization activator n=1 Tax=Fusarium oxysporum f. sp. cubense (strain race 1) TaxID=1229664 RepID=N4U1Z9_FUSC1|nr:Quinic acid utilization activator [Fusarium oxysporum f. sp. cubense race 1]
MTGNPESSVRRACESCRRKKTRCTGERPVCSFCERLNQPCEYLPRNRETVKRRRRTSRAKPGSRDRVSSVENRGDEIYDLIHHPQAASSSNGSVLTPDSLPRHTNRSGSFVESASRRMNRVSINDEVSVSWLPSATEARPSPDSLDHAVEEYRRRLYFQPLPLFNPEGLRDRIERFPMFLQWIFLALALSNLPYDSSSAKEADLIHSHTRSARDMVLELAMRGTAQLEISQALCLLALGDILEGRPALALMTIGAASRLELVRGAGYSESPHSPQGDASLRCYWSVFILEKGFAPRFTLLSQTHTKPEYPRSAREPSPPAYLGDEEYAPDLESIRDDLRTDPGITSHAVRAVSFCGDVISYLHALHIGKADNPADTNSNFYQLTNTLYDLESRLGHIHFVRNVGFSERTPEEFERHRDLVAATATIPWLFQYARDAKVSETSKENYRKCIEFLESMPDPSPRSIHKVQLLHQLQTMSSQAQDNNMISFQPSKIWQLIDSDIMDAVAPEPTVDGTQGGQSDASKTTVSVQTTFVHPVGERRTDQRQISLGDSMTADIYEGLEQYSLDSIFSQPMFIDHAWLHV